ncbi:tetratricopeptide repeat protein [Clostridium baratii]|uniref:tetratricopeptide repeat protein n=1 Tax=Clostridium baratii TaxID=1561 RepID=UPI0005F29182|nr:hypothetical protein [Clostridium baratii]AQM59882.1 hypothetical protein NPD11_2040 [Clostridium baratii]KJU72537.1 hypothetical protein UC77_03750 [Clostridium baratii]
MKKELKIILSLCFIIFAINVNVYGCTSRVNKYIQEGKLALNNAEYSDAMDDFNKALNEDKENNEAKNLRDIIIKYNEAKSLYEENNLEEALKSIESTPKEYEDYNIRNDLGELKDKIRIKLGNKEKVDEEIENAQNLIKNNEYREAKDTLKIIRNKDLTSTQEEKIEDIMGIINKNINKER